MSAPVVAPPTACPLCQGGRLLAIGGGRLVTCPDCCCHVCGQPTGLVGALECDACFIAADVAAVRREDQ